MRPSLSWSTTIPRWRSGWTGGSLRTSRSLQINWCPCLAPTRGASQSIRWPANRQCRSWHAERGWRRVGYWMITWQTTCRFRRWYAARSRTPPMRWPNTYSKGWALRGCLGRWCRATAKTAAWHWRVTGMQRLRTRCGCTGPSGGLVHRPNRCGNRRCAIGCQPKWGQPHAATGAQRSARNASASCTWSMSTRQRSPGSSWASAASMATNSPL